jgi:hypothetical protein
MIRSMPVIVQAERLITKIAIWSENLWLINPARRGANADPKFPRKY